MIRAALIAVTCLLPAAVAADSDDDVVDFSDRTTPLCEVSGLAAAPPEGWFNVPIESGDPAIEGCQMMRTRADEALVGILRVLSVHVEPSEQEAPPWYLILVALEEQNIARMGYGLGEVLWAREDVPIRGAGFENARAVGISARIEGNDTPQEAHFLLFEKGPTKYIVTLLTPARAVEGGAYYDRNVADFGGLIQAFAAAP